MVALRRHYFIPIQDCIGRLYYLFRQRTDANPVCLLIDDFSDWLTLALYCVPCNHIKAIGAFSYPYVSVGYSIISLSVRDVYFKLLYSKANATICRLNYQSNCLYLQRYGLTLNHSIISLSSYAYSRSPFSAEDNLQPLFYQNVKELINSTRVEYSLRLHGLVVRDIIV